MFGLLSVTMSLGSEAKTEPNRTKKNIRRLFSFSCHFLSMAKAHFAVESLSKYIHIQKAVNVSSGLHLNASFQADKRLRKRIAREMHFHIFVIQHNGEMFGTRQTAFTTEKHLHIHILIGGYFEALKHTLC